MPAKGSFAAVLTLFAVMPALSAAQECPNVRSGFGPFDYRTATADQRNIVEGAHFTPDVEQLRKGNTTTRIAGDVGYTLRAFPNHPRALAAMAELARRQKKDPPEGSSMTVNCWFERAVRFRPDDGNVRAVYGVSLLKKGQRADAIEQLKMADDLIPNNASVLYNLGLAYYYEKRYDQSLAYAKRAYDLGYPLPGLRNMLQKVGKWE